MEFAILDSCRRYDKEALKNFIREILEIAPVSSFVMTCNNKEAIEVMEELKKDYPKMIYHIFNWEKNYDKKHSKHYIQMRGCSEYPAEALIYAFNKHFKDNSDFFIMQDDKRISVRRCSEQKNAVSTLTDP